MNLGRTYCQQNDIQVAKDLFERALNVCNLIDEEQNRTSTKILIYNNLARLHIDHNDPQKAVDHLTDAMHLIHSLDNEYISHLEHATTRVNLAVAKFMLHDYNCSLDLLNSAHDLYIRSGLPSEHPYVNRVAYHQSRIFFALDMLDKAHMLTLKSFEAFNAALGEHHAWTKESALVLKSLDIRTGGN